MFRITQCLSVGPFALPERAQMLLAGGITHVLNVSNDASEISSATGFVEVADVPMLDNRRLPAFTMVWALDTLHRMVSMPNAHVYVHCMVGQLRSPTILWLYLIALGISPDDARPWIETRSPNAVAGYHLMVDDSHILIAQKHGSKHFLPYPRAEVVVPFPIAEDEEE